MSFGDKIRILLDVDTVGGVSSLKSFRASVAEAEGGMGKFRAAGTGAMDMVKNNAGALALAGGAALVAFGVKAVAAFEETATAAIELGKKTGLTTEEASRWIAVGDDMLVSADTIAASFKGLSKAIDHDKLAQYGIATVDAGGKARSMNDIMLDSLDVLNKMPPGYAKNIAGADLMGKGFQGLAPLMGKTRTENEAWLASVEAGQVITDGEAAQAEKMRLAQDALSDAFREVTLAVGGMVAEMAPVISVLAKVTAAAVGAATGTADHENAVVSFIARNNIFSKTLEYNKEIFSRLSDAMSENHGVTGTLITAEEKAAAATSAMSDAEVKLAEDTGKNIAQQVLVAIKLKESQAAAQAHREETDRLAEATRNGETALRNYRGELDTLNGTLSNDAAYLNLQQNIDDTVASYVELQKQIDAGTISGEEGSRKQSLAIISLKQDTIKYGEQIGLLPKDVQTLVSLIDNGQIDAMERQLTILTRNRTMNISIEASGGVGYTPTSQQHKAKGGPVSANQAYVVGDNPDGSINSTSELFVPDRPGTIMPAGSFGQRSSGGMNITINTGADPREVIRVIKEYQRRGGVL